MVHWSEQRAFADNFRGCGTILMIIPFFLLLPPEKILLVSIGGRAEGQACTDPGARTPIGASGISYFLDSIGTEAIDTKYVF